MSAPFFASAPTSSQVQSTGGPLTGVIASRCTRGLTARAVACSKGVGPSGRIGKQAAVEAGGAVVEAGCSIRVRTGVEFYSFSSLPLRSIAGAIVRKAPTAAPSSPALCGETREV